MLNRTTLVAFAVLLLGTLAGCEAEVGYYKTGRIGNAGSSSELNTPDAGNVMAPPGSGGLRPSPLTDASTPPPSGDIPTPPSGSTPPAGGGAAQPGTKDLCTGATPELSFDGTCAGTTTRTARWCENNEMRSEDCGTRQCGFVAATGGDGDGYRCYGTASGGGTSSGGGSSTPPSSGGGGCPSGGGGCPSGGGGCPSGGGGGGCPSGGGDWGW